MTASEKSPNEPVHALTKKILSSAEMAERANQLRAAGSKLVLTNGCFDLLHVGHVCYLQQARRLGDALVVALNDDASVRSIKGQNRPINPAGDRAKVLAALTAVDFVTIFSGVRVTPVIEATRPSIYAKGGDYTLETLDPEERAVLESLGVEIVILPLVAGKSTSQLIVRLQAQ